MDTEIYTALSSNLALLHIMGPHAGQSAQEIITYKAEDTATRGSKFTFWTQASYRAKPHQVKALCARGPVQLFLLKNVNNRFGGVQVRDVHIPATHYRVDEVDTWAPVQPLGIGPVIDRRKTLLNGKSRALVIGRLRLLERPHLINFKEWADIADGEPRAVRTGQGAHVICAERRDMSAFEQLKDPERLVIAVAPLVEPYAVWLRTVESS